MAGYIWQRAGTDYLAGKYRWGHVRRRVHAVHAVYAACLGHACQVLV